MIGTTHTFKTMSWFSELNVVLANPMKICRCANPRPIHLVACGRILITMGHRSREIAVEKYDVHKVNAVMLKEMGL